MKISELLGVTNLALSIKDNEKKAPDLIKALVKNLEITHRLRVFDVSKESIPKSIDNISIDIQSERNEFVINTNNLENEITKLVKAVWVTSIS